MKQCLLWIKQLNKHYDMSITLQGNKTKPIRFSCSSPNASCDFLSLTIYIPRQYKALHNAHVVAHEYAHLISFIEGHDKHFEEAYKECCLVLDRFYIPTEQLQCIIREKIKDRESYENHSLQNLS